MFVENFELHAVKTDEAIFGAKPEEPVAILNYGRDGILREAFIGLPFFVNVLGKGWDEIGVGEQGWKSQGD